MYLDLFVVPGRYGMHVCSCRIRLKGKYLTYDLSLSQEIRREHGELREPITNPHSQELSSQWYDTTLLIVRATVHT